jgi:hypothetical protein
MASANNVAIFFSACQSFLKLCGVERTKTLRYRKIWLNALALFRILPTSGFWRQRGGFPEAGANGFVQAQTWI